MGNSKWFKDVVPFNKNDLFSHPNYDVNEHLPCKPVIREQALNNSCSFEQKVATDGYFGNLENQTKINTNWLKTVSGKSGLQWDTIKQNYIDAGYSVNPYYGAMTNESALPWMANQISNNRIVQIELQYSLTAGHNVSAWGVHYYNDFRKIYIDILNSANLQNVNLNGIGRIKSMFSVWEP